MRMPHAIPRNEQCRTPQRVIALSCTAKTTRGTQGTTATFESATAVFSHRERSSGEWVEDGISSFTDAGHLWQAITDFTRVRARTWLVCYETGNELRLAQAFKWLPPLGFVANPDVIISPVTVSVGWHDNRGRSLMAVDLRSYLPHPLFDIRRMTTTDSDALCIHKAFRELVTLQHDHDLGNFARTGASNASNHWRHRHMTQRIWIHDDQAATLAERSSVYTSRTEALRWGTYRDLDEWDLPLAYPMVGLDTLLPVRLVGLRTEPSIDHQCLTHAIVVSPVPVLPFRGADGHVSWPIGTFEGWWWQPELDLAVEYGATVNVLGQYVYRAAPALRSWAEWVIAHCNGRGPLSPVQQAAVKHWGRALPGKFGSQIPNWQDQHISDSGIELELMRIFDGGRQGEQLTVGGRTLVSFERTYTDNAMPALMSRIVSECRIRLWRLMVVAGMEHVHYVDTDSLFVDHDGSERLRAFVQGGGGWGLRLKTRWPEVTILGPRQLILPSGPRVSGMAKGSWYSEVDGRWHGEATESFRGGASSGNTASVLTRSRKFKLQDGVDRRRVHLAGGLTQAVQVGV